MTTATEQATAGPVRAPAGLWGHGFGRRRARRATAVASVVVALSAVGSIAAHAAGDWGPDTCLEGYVWREAVPGDHACVTPTVRGATAYDNTQAVARRSPTGGAWGPDTCLQGYVWREAVAGDHVCVDGATRTQAATDNAQATARRNSLRVWHTGYTVGSDCTGDICSSDSTDSIPRFRVIGDHVNVGSVLVELRRLDGTLRRSWTTYASPQGTIPGGRFSLDTGYFICSGRPVDSYFRVRDSVSTRWSAPHYVASVCAVL
jgi:hypothetical protein